MEQHVDEACFLWTQWQAALDSPTQVMSEVAEGPEQRLRAHLDAIVAGGRRVAERLLKPALEGEDEERIRVAGYCLLAEGEGADVDLVLRHFAEAGEPLRPCLRQALQLSERPGLSRALHPLLGTSDVPLLRAVLEVHGFRRTHPGPVLQGLISTASAQLRAAALQSARHWPLEVESAVVLRALSSSEPQEHLAALSVGLVLDHAGAWSTCTRSIGDSGPIGELSRLALACRGEARDVEALRQLLVVPALRRDALWALGFSGRKVAAEDSLHWMNDAVHAGVAAEAFCAITGLALAGPLTKARDEEIDLAEDLPPSLDEKLPLPVPDAVDAWWSQERKNFQRDGRYLNGKVHSRERLVEAFESTSMRRRHVLALELAYRSRGNQQVETRDFSHMQRRQLQQMRH
nr:TIGR02270 family protein [Myxococcus sp. AM011]